LTPAGGKFLLDTNILIALLNGDEALRSHLVKAAAIYLPAIAIGELFYGAAKANRPAENNARIENFIFGLEIVSCDLEVAREYGLIKSRLRKKGRPIPDNDIWIAAVARRYRLVLVTRDRHFLEHRRLAPDQLEHYRPLISTRNQTSPPSPPGSSPSSPWAAAS
jgi:tRNA(fMet)-specific endonuclease VapC